jgi:hypothetical protein
MNRLARIVTAGVASGAAYLGAQAIDIAVTGHRTDDRLLLARLAPIDATHAKPIGAIMHLGNSVAFASAFELVGRHQLRGPMWWRGVLFANIENAALYPLALLEDFHPGVRDGQLDSYQTLTAFLQQVWRHSVLGFVLGALSAGGRRKGAS